MKIKRRYDRRHRGKFLIFAALFCVSFGLSTAASIHLPCEIVLWAWERPENLRFVTDHRVKIAFYAGIITFRNSRVNFKPRLNPLIVNPGTELIAVIRMENRQKSIPDEHQTVQALDLAASVALQKNISGCQIDFDCRNSEIVFYREFIRALREKLPKTVPLSITALASWCGAGSWLDDLPVEEAVPMFFRMGRDERIIKNDLANPSFMKAESCGKSVGLAVDEPLPPAVYLRNRTIYIFNSRSWTPADFSDILQRIEERINNSQKPRWAN